MPHDLPPRARWYIAAVIAAGTATFAILVPRAALTPMAPLLFLTFVSALTAAFKVQFPIASGSNMSVSYVVDIAALMLLGPHATMIVGAASGWSQTALNSQTRNPLYRTLFNISTLVLTAQAAGQVYQRLGGRADADLNTQLVAIAGLTLTYFIVNTVLIALAVALSTTQQWTRVWTSDFAPSAPSYVLGAIAAAVVIKVSESSGPWLTLLLASAPLYLTYRIYRAGREVEARQGAILAAAHDAIITMDQHLTIREFNAAAERMFGYRRIDILGRSIEVLLPLSERAQYVSALGEYRSSGTGPLAGTQVELRGQKEDGTDFPVEMTVARIGADKGAAVTAFMRDVTERRALEAQLRQSQKLEAIGRLAGGVAHDFNNLLMSIMGAADLLLMQLSRDDPARSEASEIKQSVERGAGLTRQLLAFSRRQASQPRDFALGLVIGGMDTMLRRLIGPEIEFKIVGAEAPSMVRADPTQIAQVILNLVVNAREAMPDGGRLTVVVDDVNVDEDAAVALVEGKPGPYARITVADTGSGIDDATRARLFEPFFTTKDEEHGTGLGLSIVYGIVRQSGGYITVDSEPGQGATFTIYLPKVGVAETAPIPA